MNPVSRNLRLENLHPSVIDPLHPLLDHITLESDDRSLSIIAGDQLPEAYDLKGFIRSFIRGDVEPCPPFELAILDRLKLHPLELLDLLYRHPDGVVSEAWMLNRMGILIGSHRAFAIAVRLGFAQVVECFLEVHAIEWFGASISLLDSARIHSPFSKARLTISADRSAKKVGDAYFIHAGSNAWNSGWLVNAEWSAKWDVQLKNAAKLVGRVQKLKDSLAIPECRYIFVPEKDTLARVAFPGYFNSGFLPMLIMMEYLRQLPEKSAIFPVRELAFADHAQDRFTIPDSHLCAEDYQLIFSLFLDSIGLSESMPVFSNAEPSRIHGDLGSKFGEAISLRNTLTPQGSEAVFVKGSKELQTPLRNNHIALYNDSAPVKKSLLILGDSHSSVNINPFLTYLAGCTFEKVEFLWNSFMVHDLNKSNLHYREYDYLISEVSQRFFTPAVPFSLA